MVKIVLVFSLCYLSLSAVEIGIGIGADLGIGFSKYNIKIIGSEGNLLADHLDSKEPSYSAMINIQAWFTETVGIRTGIQYGWFNYKYTYDYRVQEEAIVYRYAYKNLLIPCELIFGFPIGRNRFIIGPGLVVSKQLEGKMSNIIWGRELATEDLSDNLLKTGIHPKILIGVEFLSGNIRLQPSVSYIYGLDGVDKRFDSDCSTHHVVAGIGILYAMVR